MAQCMPVTNQTMQRTAPRMVTAQRLGTLASRSRYTGPQARPLSAEDVESLQNVVSYEVIIFCTADSAVKELAQA